MTVLPTGGGKSICFQVPALLLSGLTVVVSPLISLMADQVEALSRKGIGATFLNSTLTVAEASYRWDLIRSGRIKLLYLAPERLALGATTRKLREMGVDLLAVDEAHCVSAWGRDFRPDFLRLKEARRNLGDPQTMALTATATPLVRRDIIRLLGLKDPVEVVGGFDRPNLTFAVRQAGDRNDRLRILLTELGGEPGPCVVYAATRAQVEQVTRALLASRVEAVAYHAGLAPTRRDHAQRAFMVGDARVIVATNAFGMGIDKPDVRMVLHYLHSSSLEDYYQEAGRAGRDGLLSRCLLLFHPGDRVVHDRMLAASRISIELARNVWSILVNASGGARPVVLDPSWIWEKLSRKADPEAIRRVLAFFIEQRLLPKTEPAELRLRLLASSSRARNEAQHLSVPARRILEAMASAESHDWIDVPMAACGIPPWQVAGAVKELEGKQLAFADRLHPALVVRRDTAAVARLENCLTNLTTHQKAGQLKLDAMVGYALTKSCRRAFILAYFGEYESSRTQCGNCDRCCRSGGAWKPS